MFTFTKKIETNVAYEVVWNTGQRQDGIGSKTEQFQTLVEAQQFVLSRVSLQSATICKKEFLQKYENGKFTPAMRCSTLGYDELGTRLEDK